jgi:hypothetical protein
MLTLHILSGAAGIATRYGLDGPWCWSNLSKGEIFRTRADPLWGPPSSCIAGTGSLFQGQTDGRRGVDTHIHLVSRLKKQWSYTSTPLLGLHGFF